MVDKTQIICFEQWEGTMNTAQRNGKSARSTCKALLYFRPH